MPTLPDALSYGYVTARMLLAVADGPDEGRSPDGKPAAGTTVKITPKNPHLRFGGAVPVLVVKQPITCTVDELGHLTDPAGATGVWLVTGVYSVSYSASAFTLPAHDIEVTADHTEESPLDLTVSLPPGGAVVTPTEFAALDARLQVVESGGGSQGPEGPPGADGADGADGDDGASAYELAVLDGFVGDESTWLTSLIGPPGTDGTDGGDGLHGLDGASAYELAVADGFIGDESAWLASLVGADGADGGPGSKGDTGDTGAPGADGADGADGEPGVSYLILEAGEDESDLPSGTPEGTLVFRRLA